MASKFTAGMKNVVEALNEMWAAFASGPFNALPLTGGSLTGTLTAPNVVVTGGLAVVSTSNSAGVARTSLKMGYYQDNFGTRLIGGCDPSIGYAGYTSFETGSSSGYIERARITEQGAVLIGATTAESSTDLLQVSGPVRISSPPARGDLIMTAGYKNAPSLLLFAGNSGAFNQPKSVLYLSKDASTSRSASVDGTVNTGGNDYAEYVMKCLGCGVVAKGQIIGLTACSTITDQWADAVMFAIKSTLPSFVGGDTWASNLGPRPTPQAGPAPMPLARRADVTEQQPLPGTEPLEYLDVVTPGDTDAEWAAKQATYAAALATHAAAVEQDAEAMATFDVALEVERQKVDRIAIAGRVPVNVLGAQPGDYIVPVQDGEGIAGVAVHADDITMPQYLRAVGRVISIEPDGRAYVMVKAV